MPPPLPKRLATIPARVLLQNAIKADPDDRLAHWQLGQMQVDGKWIAADEVQRRAAADPLQTEYQQRRMATGRGFQQQLALARWCRDNKLNDESQLHWAVVLSLDPTNKEALKAVDMMWKNGRLVSRTEKPEQKQHAQDAKNAAKHWEPIIAKWRRAVSGHDVPAHDAALAEIRAIKDLDAIPSLESVTLGRDANDIKHAEECLQISMAFIEALNKMADQAATDSLVRHAVFSPGNKARALAIEELKPREQNSYVPMLLAGLAMPIESSFHVATDVNGNVHYSHALYREGADADWSYNLNKTTSQTDFGSKITLFDTYTKEMQVGTVADARKTAKIAQVSSQAEQHYGSNIATTESNVARANEGAEELNARIFPALVSTTGKDFGDNPKAWWSWWSTENEYLSSEHPVDQHYDTEWRNYYYGAPQTLTYSTAPPPPPSAHHSCFAKGTLVWTKTGQKAIDKIEPGELVLSQDIETGELKYEPVLLRTFRPSGKLMKLTTDGEELVATTGHPFWVPGTGWRMTKELGDDAILHGLQHPVHVSSIQQTTDGEAYNLVVAETSTYFVGHEGVLVHDITPRGPTPFIVPGLAKQF